MDETDYLTVPGQLFACISIVGPECPQRTDKFGVKLRGAFSSREEAEKHAKRLHKDDATFDIYVVDMYKWLLIPPDRDRIEDVHYTNEKLEEIMTKYKENQRMAAVMFEQRKKALMTADENSKYYTKPDVPPIPHPSDFIDDLKVKFPDMGIDDIVKLADVKVQEEVERRLKENAGTIVEENENETADTPVTVSDSSVSSTAPN
jgi:hypothetical protein